MWLRHCPEHIICVTSSKFEELMWNAKNKSRTHKTLVWKSILILKILQHDNNYVAFLTTTCNLNWVWNLWLDCCLPRHTRHFSGHLVWSVVIVPMGVEGCPLLYHYLFCEEVVAHTLSDVEELLFPIDDYHHSFDKRTFCLVTCFRFGEYFVAHLSSIQLRKIMHFH